MKRDTPKTLPAVQEIQTPTSSDQSSIAPNRNSYPVNLGASGQVLGQQALNSGSMISDKSNFDHIDYKHFPTIPYALFKGIDNALCSVCLHRHKNDDKLIYLPKCYHTFHTNCAYQWFK